jgi:signal transduction histidine kinase
MKQPPAPNQLDELAEREQAVGGLLRLVNEVGVTTERFFGRIYRGLDRKAQDRPATASPFSSESPLMPAQSGDPSALRQLNREMTERARDAEQRFRRFEAALLTIKEGVIVQNNEGRVILMNEAAHALLGSTRAFWESDLGRLFEKARDLPPVMSELETVGSPIRVQINNRIIGAQIAVIAPEPERTRLGTMMLLRDVTKEALADRLKDEFITQITHELRTPLTAIKGMSDVLLSQPGDKPPNRKFLEAIGRNVATVDRMIIELLDISEITAGTFSIRHEEVALDQVALEVLRGQQDRLKKADLQVGIMFANRPRLNIIGDARRLKWAINHLLDNSINYTPQSGKVLLKVGAIRGDRVLVQVEDSGVGISNRDLPHVFERFYRGEARTVQGKLIDPRGLGQGLYIARAVAEAHHGYLVVSSSVGEGSLFTLGVPFVQPER